MLYTPGPITGDELRQLRRSAGIPARVLAAAVGLSRSRVATLEQLERPTQQATERYVAGVAALIAERKAAR